MDETELQKEESARSRTPRLSAERALPRSSAELLVKIIKAYAVVSNGGESQVNYKDVGSAAGISPTVVSGNNSFLAESLILTSPKYGFFLPTEGAVRFAREAAWDENGAKVHLRKIIANSWYGQVAIQNLTLRSNLTRDELRRSLAIKCGATEGDANALGFLIDFILYTNLLTTEENGTISKGNFDEVVSESNPPLPLPTTGTSPEPGAVPRVPEIASKRSESVTLVIHIHIKDFSQLTSEHATALKNWIHDLKMNESSVEVEPDATDLETSDS